MVNAIELIFTNQQNDFLIQWEKGKTCQPPKDVKIISSMLRFVSKSHLMQREKDTNRLKEWGLHQKSKSHQLPVCTNSVQETMQLPRADDIKSSDRSEKNRLPLEHCHSHWRFVRCPPHLGIRVGIEEVLMDPMPILFRNTESATQDTTNREPTPSSSDSTW